MGAKRNGQGVKWRSGGRSGPGTTPVSPEAVPFPRTRFVSKHPSRYSGVGALQPFRPSPRPPSLRQVGAPLMAPSGAMNRAPTPGQAGDDNYRYGGHLRAQARGLAHPSTGSAQAVCKPVRHTSRLQAEPLIRAVAMRQRRRPAVARACGYTPGIVGARGSTWPRSR